MDKPPKLIPEFHVDSLDRSLAVHVGVIGFRLRFTRPEDRCVGLERDGVHLMLQELGGLGRYVSHVPLGRPYSRGVNLQIEVADVDALYARVQAGDWAVAMPLEERWYRENGLETGHRHFEVADPDGYLLRFFARIGERPAWSSPAEDRAGLADLPHPAARALAHRGRSAPRRRSL